MTKKTKPAVSVLLSLLLLFCAAFRLGCLPAGSLVAASSLSSLQPPLTVKSHLIENENVCTKSKVILVVGSANVDTFLPVSRLPSEGENLTTQRPPIVDVPGGKGCTQAVAASKLVVESSCSDEWVVRFVGQLGMEDEKAAQVLSDTLDQHHIDYSHCGFHKDLPSGRGYVFWTQSGSVSAVVSGGSNQYGWSRWKDAWENPDTDIEQELDQILSGVKCIMLQREVPEYVNLLIASRAKQIDPTIVVIQDIGGEDRPISKQMLDLCDYVVPNESELIRLVLSSSDMHHLDESHRRQSSGRDILEYAQALQRIGASNVLVTQGSRGSFLVDKDGQIHNQKAIPVPSSATVIDETGAGDCFRAAFCVALMEGHDPSQCMLFASSAGSCSVEVNGAVPSTPSRSRVLDRMADGVMLDIPRGDGQQQSSEANGGTKHSDNVEVGETENLKDNHPDKKENRFPFLFGSRLNSMKDRPDLWEGKPLENPKDYVERQASVEGLTCVDFNYPQHFAATHWTSAEAKATLQKAGLVAGAVCLRYPSSFARGAMNHPSLSMRQKAIKLTKEAAEVAMELGTNEVVIWSAFDGYDYPFQVEYGEKWDQLVSTFQELCDEYPSIKFSLEFKPTDENTRFFTVPTTGAALLFVEEVNRPNMGLTLDVGHMLMAGENPGQSIAMVGRRKKLFGIQLNDGFTRLAAEDGLMFGSVHPSMALEIMYQLRMTNFCGHIYFDTFPQRSDPVTEAEYNILQAKRFWNAACSIDPSELKRITDEHDAIGALNMINRLLWAR
ncbi:xylose isomerase domain containing protein [Nitzschia inconspicua]|uniref:Xylose isomerase domain containing protein n=1 Tax=Nitzschia inconspicua TaxID=303405 RepID=A0A9K3Q1G2_9STRA|nr:xylose isomerase domain containing protein [Nitzschia inconspicua]